MKKKIKFILRIVFYSIDVLASLFGLFVVLTSNSINWGLFGMLFTSICCIFGLCFWFIYSFEQLIKLIREKK